MITPIQIEETKEWLKDLELSCHNHMRGMADCHDIEYYRFKMRAEALAIALEIIEEYKDKKVRMKEIIDENIRLKAILDKVNVEKMQGVLTGSVREILYNTSRCQYDRAIQDCDFNEEEIDTALAELRNMVEGLKITRLKNEKKWEIAYWNSALNKVLKRME